MEGGKSDPYLFGLNVKNCPRWLLLSIASFGIFTCFLAHSFAHEKLMYTYQFTETIFLTFLQFTGYFVLVLPTVYRLATKKQEVKAPLYLYVITSAALGLSMSLANFAALRLSYATEVLFKSAKLIPVLIGNIIFLKKIPSSTQVLSVCLVVVGLVGISLGDFRGKNKFDAAGVVAVCAALCFDALSSNMEEKCMHQYKSTQNELIAFLYGIGAVATGLLSLANGQLVSGFKKIIDQPMSIIFIGMFALMGAMGIQFVYLIIHVWDSLHAVMVTSLRKAMSVILSFTVFKNKTFTSTHAWSIVVLVFGIGINTAAKFMNKKKVEDPIQNEESSLLANIEVELDLDAELPEDEEENENLKV